MAIDNNGICYMADIATNSLYTINLITGVETLVGDLGVDIAYAQDADVDTATNILYMAGYLESGESNIYSINVTTGAATNLGPVSGGAELGVFSIQGPPVTIENFSCATALPISLGIENAEGLSNTENGASNICLSGASNALWYKYTALNSGELTITSDLSSNSGVDTRVSVYYNNCNALVCIDSNDNGGSNNTSLVVLPVVSGTTYLIEWDDANGNSDFDFELLLNIACPDPLNFMASAFDSTTATFSWDAVAEATNGYIISVFEGGADPQTGTPVYTENVPAGITTATATGLEGSTVYDAYLTADCNTQGFSNDIKITLETEMAPPVCGGKFYDTGGPTGTYGNSENYSILIVSGDPGNLITLDFLSVDIELGFDQLHIYDGDDATANELSDPMDGVQEPGTYTSNIPGGNLFITFSSDAVFAGEGWDADVICTPAPDCLPPFNFETTNIDLTTANFTWEAIANATNGYILSVFNEGDDPATNTPVFSETIAAGTTTGTAIGLIENTLYDAYVVSDCDAAGLSTMTKTTFSTDYPSPACGGVFLDSGGSNGDYLPNENTTTIISPDVSGDVVTVTFTSFSVEEDWDALYVYDGPDASYPMIDSGNPVTGSGFPAGGYYGTTIPGPFTSTDASGALTFVFRSDESFNGPGWEADVSCAPLGINDNVLEGFSFYPNPSKGILSVNAAANIEIVVLYNMLGQKVMTITVDATSSQIDISNLSIGTYIMKVTIEGQTGTYKVLRN